MHINTLASYYEDHIKVKGWEIVCSISSPQIESGTWNKKKWKCMLLIFGV